MKTTTISTMTYEKGPEEAILYQSCTGEVRALLSGGHALEDKGIKGVSNPYEAIAPCKELLRRYAEYSREVARLCLRT